MLRYVGYYVSRLPHCENGTRHHQTHNNFRALVELLEKARKNDEIRGTFESTRSSLNKDCREEQISLGLYTLAFFLRSIARDLIIVRDNAVVNACLQPYVRQQTHAIRIVVVV